MNPSEDECTICRRRLNVEGDELSHDCGGDCWGCVGAVEADMGHQPSLDIVLDEWRRGFRPDWKPPGGIAE